MANLKHAEDDPKHVKMSAEISASPAQGQPAEGSSVTGRDPVPVPVPAPVPVPCSFPTFAAASELLSAPYSCLVLNTNRRHISLPPVYLNKKRTGIKEELQAELFKFSHSLKGVPMAYDNIRILGQHGNIYDDSGYIHMDIQAEFIIFQPQRGLNLLGKVNKISASHVGCLVHGCFNASIPKPNLVSMETWRDAGPRIGADLEFEVTTLDADVFGVLLIRGRLDRTRVQELLALGESSESGITTEEPEPAETEPKPEQEPTEEAPAESPQKRKKKKKKVKDEDTEEAVTSVPTELDGNTTLELDRTMEEANGNDTIEKKKKKKKKDKRVKDEGQEVQLSLVETHGCSDSSGYISDKSSKKRKHETETEIQSHAGDESDAPKSKKKKRKSNIEATA